MEAEEIAKKYELPSNWDIWQMDTKPFNKVLKNLGKSGKFSH